MSFIPNNTKKLILDTYFLDSNRTFKIGLLDPNFADTASTLSYYSDITNEITSDNYTAGGKTLQNFAVSLSSGSAYVDADDVSEANSTAWQGITADIRYVFLWEDTGTASTSPILAVQEYDATRSPFVGSFEHIFANDGYFKLM